MSGLIYGQRGVTVNHDKAGMDWCYAVAEDIERKRDGSPETKDMAARGTTMLQSRFGSNCAELALALLLGVEWKPEGPNHKKGDVDGIEVRWTRYTNKGYFKLYKRDDLNKIAVFVRGDPPRMTVVGWMMIGDAQRPEWLNESLRLSAYEVPHSYELEDIGILIDEWRLP